MASRLVVNPIKGLLWWILVHLSQFTGGKIRQIAAYCLKPEPVWANKSPSVFDLRAIEGRMAERTRAEVLIWAQSSGLIKAAPPHTIHRAHILQAAQRHCKMHRRSANVFKTRKACFISGLHWTLIQRVLLQLSKWGDLFYRWRHLMNLNPQKRAAVSCILRRRIFPSFHDEVAPKRPCELSFRGP